MTRNMVSRIFLLLLFDALLVTCAKISTPSGGPRDKLPPVLVKSEPENSAKNFKENSFIVTFDEFVTLDNINDKLLVSPPMKKKPKVLIKSKSVNVEYEDELKDSTTYAFFFMDAIRDLNEGNKLEDFRFVFSTGPVIDSLSVTGNVFNSQDLEIPEETIVMMFRELADSAVKKHLPDYITRVKPDGYFRIDNVRPGKYRLFALKDEDNSKNYNLLEEEFSFLDSVIAITPERNFIPEVKDTTVIKKIVPKPTGQTKIADTKPVEPIALKGEYQLFLFKSPKKNHYLAGSSRDKAYRLNYLLSALPDTMKVDFSIPGADDKYFKEWSREKDTLSVWLTDSSLYSQQQLTTFLTYPFTDTLQVLGYKLDTLSMRYTAPRAPRSAKVKKIFFKVNTNISGGILKPGQPLLFESETPFRNPDSTQIALYEIEKTEEKRINYTFRKDSINSRRYYLDTPFQPGKKYLFRAWPNAFGNIYEEYSDTIKINFSVKETEEYSKLTLKLKNYSGSRIIQLLDKTENLISQKIINKEEKLVFQLLEAGFYRLRVIYDLNGDGKWTTGDFDTGRQPEPVSYYPEEIEIKTGWELDQDWDMGVKNFKDQKMKASNKK